MKIDYSPPGIKGQAGFGYGINLEKIIPCKMVRSGGKYPLSE
ncbi:hypothetical protein C1O63_0617 [Dehalococcoides mccartyi]|nr:hypothetical protein C1O63_0617 [Dehalococcoides mccartyi]